MYVVSSFVGAQHSKISLYDPQAPDLHLVDYYFQSALNCTGIDDSGRLLFRGGRELPVEVELESEEDSQFGLWEFAYPVHDRFPQGKEAHMVLAGV